MRRGYASGPPQAAVMRPSVQAGVITASQDGRADANVAPSVPKFNLTVPQSTPSGGACWNGQEVQVDIIIDRSIGKATSFTLQFDVAFGGAAGTAYIASSASFVTRIDQMYNGNVIETIYAPNLLEEGIVFNTDLTIYQQAKLWGIDVNTPNVVSPAAVTVPVGGEDATYYLPLSGFFANMQPFVAGLRGELRYRLYLAPQVLCNANGFVSTPGVTCQLKALNLWTEEATLSDESYNHLMQQHKSGINYRSVLRTVWSRTQPTLTANQTQTDILNAFNNDSAALLVWLNNASTDPGYFLNRYPLKTLQMLDAGGATLTRVFPASLVEQKISPSQTPIGSNFLNSPTFTSYIFPWCSSLDRVLYSSRVLGGLKLSAAEQLIINPVSNHTGAVETVVSFDYCAVRVQNGELKWAKQAEDFRPEQF